jgi:hypothetical protein
MCLCTVRNSYCYRQIDTEKRIERIMKTQIRPLLRALALLAVLSASNPASACYDPGAQRWINRDPLGDPGFRGAAKENRLSVLAQPNSYVFLRNSPCLFLDSDGLTAIVIGAGGAAIGAGETGAISNPIGAALCAGAAVGATLCWAFPNVMTKPGEWIGNWVCPRSRAYRETCFLATEFEGYCLYTCPSGIRVFPRPVTGCPIRFTFKSPNPLNPTWRP